jgi:hypothetical protein
MKKLLVLAALTACGGNDVCHLVDDTGCDTGLVCEEVAGGGDPICAKPLVIRGDVFRLGTSTAVGGAKIVALDANGAPQSPVATSSSGGAYELRVPASRTSDGTPVGAKLTLRADAAGYLTFPSGIRQALPIDTGTATAASDAFVVDSALTDVGLVALDGAPAGTIAGTAALPASHAGVLVVAETSAGAFTSVADTSGAYAIFNVPPGNCTVAAYAKGVSYAPATGTVVAAQTVAVDLALGTAPTSTVSGSVQIVNPESGDATSVILVLESTFNPALARGESPPGLRAPAPGVAPNITGGFSIEGVPAGKYVVLAAFENDNLVRDPDAAIGNTQIRHIEVTSGVNLSIGSTFKITGALDVLGPGVDRPEEVTEKPMLRFARDSGAAEYEVRVHDALGIERWKKEHVTQAGSSDVSIPYEGPLEAGMYYQFKAVSIKTGGTSISSTEDLRGVFFKR